jgi:hypothetical protein
LDLLRRSLIEIGEQQSRHRRSRAARATGARAGCDSVDDPQPDPHRGDLTYESGWPIVDCARTRLYYRTRVPALR